MLIKLAYIMIVFLLMVKCIKMKQINDHKEDLLKLYIYHFFLNPSTKELIHLTKEFDNFIKLNPIYFPYWFYMTLKNANFDVSNNDYED